MNGPGGNSLVNLTDQMQLNLIWIICHCYRPRQGGALAVVVHSTPNRAVRVRALAGDMVLCS